MIFKNLRTIVALALVLILGAPLEARTRKGDRFYKQAQEAELKKDWDTALQFYVQAVDEDPKDTGYLIGLQKSRFESAGRHVERGQAQRTRTGISEARSNTRCPSDLRRTPGI